MTNENSIFNINNFIFLILVFWYRVEVAILGEIIM